MCKFYASLINFRNLVVRIGYDNQYSQLIIMLKHFKDHSLLKIKIRGTRLFWNTTKFNSSLSDMYAELKENSQEDSWKITHVKQKSI